MFTHCVFFWLKPTTTAVERTDFANAVRGLTALPSVVHGSFGAPADTDRPVIDRSYSFGLMVIFRDLAGHDAYQIDPQHLAFKERFSRLWDRLQVYDFEGS